MIYNDEGVISVRVTMHNGRSGLAKHNDRSFEVEQAEHIDTSRADKNKYWQMPEYAGMTFTEMERAFYQDAFAEGLEARNKRYLEQRHPERCKSVESLLHGAKTRPEEEILAIGDRNDGVSPEEFAACVNDYVSRMDAWNHAHGSPFRLLNAAVHADERGAVHAHLRRVWVAPDADGNLMPNQSRALQRAGVERPNSSVKESRRNNRKISFDRMARAMWQEVCKKHGFQIETDPVKPDRRHMKTADYIRADNAGAAKMRKETEAKIAKLTQEVEGLEARKSEMVRREKSVSGRERDLQEWENDADERAADLEKREKRQEVKETIFEKIAFDLPKKLLKIANASNSKVKKNTVREIDADLKKLNMPGLIDAIIEQVEKSQNAPAGQIPEGKKSRERSKFDTVFDKEEQEREDILREV